MLNLPRAAARRVLNSTRAAAYGPSARALKGVQEGVWVSCLGDGIKMRGSGRESLKRCELVREGCILERKMNKIFSSQRVTTEIELRVCGPVPVNHTPCHVADDRNVGSHCG